MALEVAGRPSGHLTGRLGNDNGSTGDDLTTRGGTVVPYPSPPAVLYGAFSDSWRLSQSESLFDYAPGQSTATFTDLGFPFGNASITTLPAADRAAAEALCQ